MDAITEASSLIKRAISELDAERQRLEGALESLDGGSSPSNRPGRPAGARSGPRKARRRRRRAPKGGRRQEVLALIDRKPGITGAVLAKELGTQSSQVYNLTGKLVKEKVIRKRGATYEMMPGAPATKIVATKKKAAATTTK
jgi:hypothetical protein